MPMFYLQGHKGTFPIEFSHLFLSAQKVNVLEHYHS